MPSPRPTSRSSSSSIDSRKSFDEHFELGSRLAALRESGVLIAGSGNVVHNLRAIDWSAADLGYDWAQRFDEASRTVLTERPGDTSRLQRHGDFARAVPTPDHFIPLIYFAALADAAHEPANVLIDGYAMGSISMTCYTVGCRCAADEADPRPAAAVPDPAVVPPDDANI